jgi:hypothetical protein
MAISLMPALPGATNNLLHKGLSFIFKVKACSLPPEPRINIFIFI